MSPRLPDVLRRRSVLAGSCFMLAALLALLALAGGDGRGWHFAPGAHAKTDRAGTYDLAKARMLARVVGHIRAHYVAPERIDPKAMAVAALERVQIEVPEVRVEVQRTAPRGAARNLLVTVGSVTREFGLEKVGDLYELNWKLMDIFDFLERHLPPQVDLEALEYAAINGVLSTLDPHTLLLSPRTYRELQLSQRGRFGGLGLTVGEIDGTLVIQGVMRDTPAAEAGVQEGDTIAQIGGESAVNMDLDAAVSLLRGEPGSQITLWLRRDGWPAARPFTLTRREIQIPSAEGQALGHGIGYIVVRAFQEATDQDVEAALEQLDKMPGGLKGLVLDLRDNPGGLLDKAIAISDMFLSQGTVVTTVRDAGKEREETHATLAETRADLPVVVLVNKGSASASEIVSGALKRNDRALVIGQRTFGKGSVQVIYRIDEAALKLTIAQYLTPGDVSIQGVGIVPDIDIVTLRVPGGPAAAGAPPASEGILDLHPAPEDQGGEAALAAHLSSDKTKDERPAAILRLLDDAKVPTNRQPRGAEKVPDGLVTLAKDILRAAPAPNRKQALVQLAGFLTERQAAEDQRLTAALAPLAIDWKPNGGVDAKAPIEAKLVVGGGQPLRAGQKVEVELTLKNTGRRAVHRVFAELDSGLAPFARRELAFGVLEPDKAVTKKLVFTLPPATPAAGDRVVARLWSEATALDARAEALISVVPRDPPIFAHTVQVLDAAGASASGNGDGLLQRGEKVTVAVWVTNIGLGPSEATLATLKNQAGPDVYLSLGRQELGRLEPGQTAQAKFELEVLPSLEARVVGLELSLSDARAPNGVDATAATVELPVHPDGMPKREPAKGLLALGTSTTPILAGAHRDTPPVAEAGPSAILQVRAKAGEWFEVEWPGERHGKEKKAGPPRTGWVPFERGRIATEGGVTNEAVKPVTQESPPILTFAPIATVTDGQEVVIEGLARFDSASRDAGGPGGSSGRRMVYVFRGREKVFFSAAEGTGTARDALPFKVVVPLEPGKNEVFVFAREGEGRPTRVVFMLHRK